MFFCAGTACMAASAPGRLPLQCLAWSIDPLSGPRIVWGCVGIVWVVWGTGSCPQQAEQSYIYFALLEAGCACLGEGAALTAPSLHPCLHLGNYGGTRCQAMELQHQLQPKLGILSLTGLCNIGTIGHPEACRDEGSPKQDPQNKCC